MPAKSKAQQRLMQAADHGASFPMARKLRAAMSHQQLHDFAVGSEAGKPTHVAQPKVKRTLPPALAAHGQKVKRAHATLMKRPEYAGAPPLTRMAMVQAHIRKRGAK